MSFAGHASRRGDDLIVGVLQRAGEGNPTDRPTQERQCIWQITSLGKATVKMRRRRLTEGPARRTVRSG